MEIPGYKILDTLGQGGMATVYLAIQKSFEREVALKVMSSALLQTDPSFGERFIREARIVSRLVHPNIVTVFDVGEFEGHHFLSMEYIAGRDLKEQRLDLCLPESIRVVKEVALALDYAGKKGYVHRDVKPENIMLHCDDGRALLMDFGIAKVADHVSDMTQTGTAIGTPHYMSPEQAKGLSVDSRSDLYSLGVVLYLLLTGYVPFDAESAVAVGIKHVSEPIPLLPSHLGIFQPIIDKALAKDPAERYQQGGEIIKALSAITPTRLDAIESVAAEMADSMGIPADMPEGMAKDELKKALNMGVSEGRGAETAEAVTITGGGVVDDTLIAAAQASLNKASSNKASSNKASSNKASSNKVKGSRAMAQASMPESYSELESFSEIMHQAETQQAIKPKIRNMGRIGFKWLFMLIIIISGVFFWKPELQPVWLPMELQRLSQRGRQFVIHYLELVGGTESRSEFSSPSALSVSPPLSPASSKPSSKPSSKAIMSITEDQQKTLGGENEKPEIDRLRDLRPVVATADINRSILVASGIKGDRDTLGLQDLQNTHELIPEKTEAERRLQQEIISELEKAEEYLKHDALSRPEGVNALDRYKNVLILEPKNAQAVSGIAAIVTRYGVLATRSQRRGQLSQADGYLQQALLIAPNNLASLKQQQQLSVQIQQRSENKRKLRKLESEAQRYFKQGQWLSPKGHNALQSYQKILQLKSSHSDARRGLKNIETGLAHKVAKYMSVEDFSAAEAILQAAVVVFPRSSLLIEQRQALVDAIDARTPKIPQLIVSEQALTSLDLAPSSALQVSDRVIYIGFQYRTFQLQNSVVQAVLYDGARSLKIAQKAVIVSGAEGQKFFSIERPVQGFSVGGYSIDLILGDTLLASAVFNVIP